MCSCYPGYRGYLCPCGCTRTFCPECQTGTAITDIVSENDKHIPIVRFKSVKPQGPFIIQGFSKTGKCLVLCISN